jgi:hypothetical protein
MAEKTIQEIKTEKPKGKGRLFFLVLIVVITLLVLLLRRGSKSNGEKKA